MGSSFANLTLRLLFAGAALAVVCPAEAQHAGRRPGEAILFSSPDGDDVSSNMPSLAAKPPEMLDFENAIQSPGPNLGGASGNGAPAAPRPPISPAQVQAMQRQLDERKNWALLTPEQILGLPTQEKILGIQDRDAFGRPKNESVVAQYYERQEMSRTRTNNDNYAAAEPAPQWGILGGQSPQMGPNIWTPAGSRPGNSAFLNQFLNGTPDSRDAAAQAPQSGWSKSFNLPAPPKATPEQEAAMAQFRQLLEPHSPPDGAARTPASDSPFFSRSTAHASGPSTVIPIGKSFTPLSSGIAMPAGPAPLPGLLGPTNAAASVFAPEWKPQPPPRMSSQPQLGVIPQRKF